MTRLYHWWGPPCSTAIYIKQVRNMIFAATPHHPAILESINQIVRNLEQGTYKTLVEPRRTLVLTGPGTFTDAVRPFMNSLDTTAVPHTKTKELFEHHLLGGWKPKDFNTGCLGFWLTAGVLIATIIACIILLVVWGFRIAGKPLRSVCRCLYPRKHPRKSVLSQM